MTQKPIPGSLNKKEDDVWDYSKRYLLNDPKELLNILKKYDRDSIKA